MLLFWTCLHLVVILTSANNDSKTSTTDNNEAHKDFTTTATMAKTSKPITSKTSKPITSKTSKPITSKTIKPITSESISKNETSCDKKQTMIDNLLCIVQEPLVIISFGIGVFVTASIFLLGIICCKCICCRSKQKSSGNLSESLEMVSTQAVRSIETGQQHEEEYKTETIGSGGETSGQIQPHSNSEDHQVEYSDIDFSALKRQRAAIETQENTESEYAEIKRETTEEIEQNEETLKEEEVSGDGLENEQWEQTEEWDEEEALCQETGHDDA